MGLIINKSKDVFDLTQIARGYLFYGKHKTWDEGKSGIVTSAREDKLIIQYHPEIGNITNHYYVHASEVIKDEWEIRWSKDLTEINEYGTESAESGDIDDEF